MIAFCFVALFSLGLFHWAYESAIAPSVRLGARYKLFALRDQLRTFAAQTGVQLNREAIETLEESLNATIQFMHEFNFEFFRNFSRRYAQDESFRQRVDQRRITVESYELPEFREMRRAFEYLFREINAINSGGWFVYILPIALVAVCWDSLRGFLKNLSVVPCAEFASLARVTETRSLEAGPR